MKPNIGVYMVSPGSETLLLTQHNQKPPHNETYMSMSIAGTVLETSLVQNNN